MSQFVSNKTQRTSVLVLMFCSVVVLGDPPAAESSTYDVSHAVLDGLLKTHVHDGQVDYKGLRLKEAELQSYLESLAAADVSTLKSPEKLALYINAYNAATIKLILENYAQIKSVKDIPRSQHWDDERWVVGGRTISLKDLEHEVLRKEFSEPRIHFAIVCASIGCPDLRNEAYVADKIEEQLEDQAKRFHRSAKNFRWDAEKGALYLSSIFKWFAGDFEKGDSTVIAFVSKYCEPTIATQLKEKDKDIRIRYLDYDWNLNGK